jgi:hypothetical protein
MLSNRAIMGLSTVAVLACIGGLAWYSKHRAVTPEPVAIRAPPAETPPVVEPPPPTIAHPIPEDTSQVAPLPELNASDASMLESLTGLFGAQALDQFLVPQDVIRHIVATIDNLPNRKVAQRLSPMKAVPGKFLTRGNDNAIELNSENDARYLPLVQLVQATNTDAITALYFHFYPLFQQAYQNLGYPDKYFNDRVVVVIDHLLETPDVKGPIRLTQPNVMFEYEDPDLEARSYGQKALIRMGSENAAALKAKLRRFREAITKEPPQR